MEKRHLVTIENVVCSVMHQLKFFLTDGALVHFKIPLECEYSISEDFPMSLISRAYDIDKTHKLNQPIYIEFDAVFDATKQYVYK